ncbi:glycine--tRNA ligase [Candidatus Xianfuyuplasma coldseepsis]|uniref:Glycine--tRNA ligase n=1 Tax=Candidatus Xianfuyuplasma coldseepsis TaxID=2782163 RepID=A0A7L7KT82_9MOLU|nr:glycine--tRNA ligase [Xianfuyuplasma coldseepsis]QMS85907.1 glycine--tRNA ligase [Xianfuyuplasma coldseepsis]
MNKISMEELVNYAKNYGFVFQGSEIYGGLANTWDYGPLGVLLKNNIKQSWWKKFIQEGNLNVGLDSSILLNPKVWEASGHVGGFSDPLTDCKQCNTRHRADKLIEEHTQGAVNADGWSNDKMMQYIIDEHIVCPNCGALSYTDIRQFNLMFKTSQGVTTDSTSDIYLRPETAQGIFLNFKHIQRTSRKKVPFGIGQIGKSFRNEITPGNFIFRTREFEQMELEFFCKPGTELEWFDYWKNTSHQFLLSLGLRDQDIRLRDHLPEQLSHYSNATTDIEFQFPWGFDELWGIASRTDYDLKQHQEYSSQNLEYLDPITNEKYLPYVIEPSLGVERLFLAILSSAYQEETLDNGETRINLQLAPHLAPYQVAVLPLIKKYHKEAAEDMLDYLSNEWMVTYDESGKIGRRYRRQDAIGTPFVVTVDDDSINNKTFTVRHRDSMEQVTLTKEELIPYLREQLKY